MRKLALMFGALGFIAFTGLANADEKTTENSVKTESSTTIGGKHKTVKTKKVVAADGTTTESKTEVVTPKTEKSEKPVDSAKPVRNDDKTRTSEVSEKTEDKTTLTGKHQIKTTKKVEKPDGTTVESTTTKTEPAKK
jgi:cytoskeletal protein RodZ